VAKKAARSQREMILGAKQLALPDRKYCVILADPPWRFAVYSRETGLNAAADNHYQCDPIEDIAALWAALPVRRFNPFVSVADVGISAWPRAAIRREGDCRWNDCGSDAYPDR
jgi:hypothetical protein